MSDITSRIVRNLPIPLSDALQQILDPSITSSSHQKFVSAVKVAKKACETACEKGDATYFYDVQARLDRKLMNDTSPKREIFYRGYIDYLGIALYFCENSEMDAAWHYYAKSEYFLGLYRAFDEVLESIDYSYQHTFNLKQGAKKKAKNESGPLRRKFLEIIESPPEGGWKSEKELLEAAEPELQSFHVKHDHKYIKYENILDSAKNWLGTDDDIRIAYAKNSIDPDNALKVLRQSQSLMELLIDELIRIIEAKPKGGWESLKQLLAVAEPKLQAIHEASGHPLPFDETIRSCIERWSMNITRVWYIFDKNSRNGYSWEDFPRGH